MKLIRYGLILLSLCSLLSPSQAQLHDNTWLVGYGVYTPNHQDFSYRLDFSGSSLALDSLYRNLQGHGSVASMSDSAGQLMFYSNGLRVYNANFQAMPNGHSLAEGMTGYNSALTGNGGYGTHLGVVEQMLCLPAPGQPHRYYLLHTATPSPFSMVTQRCNHLLCTTIDMSLEQGLGDVLTKNEVLMLLPEASSGIPTAMKHSNGRDWWVLLPQSRGFGYWRILLSDTGVAGPWLQDFPSLSPTHSMYEKYTTFSEDGELFIMASNMQVYVHRFDRCTGLLSEPDIYPLIPDVVYPQASHVSVLRTKVWGVVLSPNKKYVYIPCEINLQRLNLEDSLVQAEIIADYDSFFTGPLTYWSSYHTSFFSPRLALDGKIYIGSVSHLHLIHEPDFANCQVQRRALHLPANLVNPYHLPNFPHYRTKLGEPCVVAPPPPPPPPPPAPGEPVVGPPSSPVYGGQPGTGELGDTLLVGPWLGGGGQTGPSDSTGLSTQAQASASQRLRLYPNPATQLVTLVLPQGLSGQVQLHCYNSLGQLLRQTQLEASSSSLEYSLQDLAPGLYYLQLRQGEKTWTASLRVQ